MFEGFLTGAAIGVAAIIPTAFYLRERQKRQQQAETYERRIADLQYAIGTARIEMTQVSTMSEMRRKRVNRRIVVDQCR